MIPDAAISARVLETQKRELVIFIAHTHISKHAHTQIHAHTELVMVVSRQRRET